MDLLSVCVSGRTGPGMMAAAAKAANEQGLKLVDERTGPLPFMHNDSGPPVSTFRTWGSRPGSGSLSLTVSIVREDVEAVSLQMRGVRWNICMLSLPESADLEAVTRAIEARFKTNIVLQERQGRRRPGTWIFAEDERAGTCGRVISLSGIPFGPGRPAQVNITLTDMDFPLDPAWQHMSHLKRCRQ